MTYTKNANYHITGEKIDYDSQAIKAVKSLRILAKPSFTAFSIYEQPRFQIC